MPQLAFEWPRQASYVPEDYIVSESNAAAAQFLETWTNGAVLITGEKSCGKTHLAHCWLARVNGSILDKSRLGTIASDELWPSAAAVLEDIETVTDEAALFHLLRHAESSRKPLLLTANAPARQLPFCLPDLRSRLLAIPCAAILPPDEKLLEIFATKCFSDRQLRIGDDVIRYVTKRVERSFEAVLALINSIEKISSETGRDITIPLISKIVTDKS